MDVLPDAAWMRDLCLSSPLERFRRGRFVATAVAAHPTAARHQERYRYRLFLTEAGQAHPAIAVNLESDLLGTWRLTLSTASGTRIAAAFDEPPGYEVFKALALALADEASAGRGPSAPSRRAAKGGPRTRKPRPGEPSASS